MWLINRFFTGDKRRILVTEEETAIQISQEKGAFDFQ